MKYRLILADFDNTIHCDNSGIYEGTAQAIKEYQNRGGKFVVCTGRMLDSILPFAKSMDLTGELAACQGSAIYNLDNKEYILKGGLPNNLAVEILEYLESTYEHVHLYIEGQLYVNVYDDITKSYEDYCRIKAHPTNMPASKFMKEYGGYAEKLLVLNDTTQNYNCYLDVYNKFSSKAVVSTSSEHLVEVADFNYSKGKTLEFLANKYNIPIEQTLAIGDSLNDLTMIKTAGKGVAVGNAHEQILKAANEVTINCNQGAVLHIIKKYGLGE